MKLHQVTVKRIHPNQTSLAILTDDTWNNWAIEDLGFVFHSNTQRSQWKYGEEFKENSHYELNPLLMTVLAKQKYSNKSVQFVRDQIMKDIYWSPEALTLYRSSIDTLKTIKAIKNGDMGVIIPIIEDFGLDPAAPEVAILKEHQFQSLALYITLDYCANWGQMRTGKTPPSIVYAYARFIKQEIETCLIICPNSIKHIWLHEVGKFVSPLAQELSTVIEGNKSQKRESWNRSSIFKIANYDCVRADYDIIMKAIIERGIKWGSILDESHNIKNESKRTRAVRNLVQSDNPPVFCLCLSGTPIANKPHDVQRVVNLVQPSLLCGTFEDFKNKFCWSSSAYGNITNYKKNVGPNGEDALEVIRNRMARMSVRVLRSEVNMELGKYVNPQELDMHDIQAKVHNDIMDTLSAELYGDDGVWDIIKVNGFLAKLMKLQQVTAGFLYNNNKQVIWLPDKQNPKLLWLDDFIEQYMSDIGKLVIACKFVPIITRLTNRYQEYGATCIYGAVKPQERAERMEKFRDTKSGCDIMVLNIKISEGLDLNPAQFMVFTTKEFYLLPNSQTEDRITGHNQIGEATIIPLLCNDSIDVSLEELLKKKQEWADATLGDGGKTMPQYKDGAGLTITKEDLFTLVRRK